MVLNSEISLYSIAFIFALTFRRRSRPGDVKDLNPCHVLFTRKLHLNKEELHSIEKELPSRCYIHYPSGENLLESSFPFFPFLVKHGQYKYILCVGVHTSSLSDI